MPGQGGLAKDARYQVSTDDGATFDDNGGLGFSLSDLNTTGPLSSIGVQLRLPDQSSTFNDGDQVTLQLIDSDAEDVFALFDELELALREFDDVNTLGAADYDGNGISDDQDIDNAVQQVIDDNNLVQNPMTGAELTFYTDQARNKRFSEIANERVQKLLARMDNALNQVSDNQSLVGLGINKVDSADAANVFLHEQVTGTLAQIEDTDFLEAVSELSLVENALQAATSTTSRVVQGISLLDYLS
jgi:flagellin-like hook-associated protein FlgL